MRRYGLPPSNDPRWAALALELLSKAETKAVSLPEFYRGLVAIMDAIDDRLSVSVDELSNAEREA